MLMRPWFVHNSIFWLESRIQSDWVCFEWGSGRSTIWLAEQAAYVISTEHDKEWYEQVCGWLKEHGLAGKGRVNYHDLGTDEAGYINAVSAYHQSHFDLISVDGRRRSACIRAALPHLRPDGLLVVDNSERPEYQEALALVRGWEGCDWRSGNSEGWTTSVFFKPKG